MKTRKLFILFFFLYCFLIPSNILFGAPAKLLAGTAKVNITPRDNGTVHDSLYAREAWFEDNHEWRRWPGYIADIRGAALGGYGADTDAKIIEVGAGESIMNRQLENFYILNGLMRDKPGPGDFVHGTRYQVIPVAPLGQPQPKPLDKK
jgi:hypothetical protein